MQRYRLWERTKDAIGKFKAFTHAMLFPFEEMIATATDHADDHFFRARKESTVDANKISECLS